MDIPFLSNIHTHTCFCDGKDLPSVLVRKAADMGFVSLGFSGHGPAWWDNWSMKPEALPEYKECILALRRQWKGILDILLGIEHDHLGEPVSSDYDYVIESVHAIEKDGRLCYIDWDIEKFQTAVEQCFSGDPYRFAKAYFQTCAEAYQGSSGRIVGHLDLITKFNERYPVFNLEDPRFLNPALEAVNTALENGMIIEVNTGAISRGYRSIPYPCVPILHHIRQKHAPVVVTSDCHDAVHLACQYQETSQLLQMLGFRSTLRLRSFGWEEIGI